MEGYRAKFSDDGKIYEADRVEVKDGSGGPRTTFYGNVRINGKAPSNPKRWDRQGRPKVLIRISR